MDKNLPTTAGRSVGASITGSTSPVLRWKAERRSTLFIHDFPDCSVDIDLASIPLESRGRAAQRAGGAHPYRRRTESETGIRAVLQTHNPRWDAHHCHHWRCKLKLKSRQLRGHYILRKNAISSEPWEEFGFAALPVVSLRPIYTVVVLCCVRSPAHPEILRRQNILIHKELIARYSMVLSCILLSHNRPLSEVLNPRWKILPEPFQNEFSGMDFWGSITEEEQKRVPERMLSMENAFHSTGFRLPDVILNAASQTGI